MNEQKKQTQAAPETTPEPKEQTRTTAEGEPHGETQTAPAVTPDQKSQPKENDLADQNGSESDKRWKNFLLWLERIKIGAERLDGVLLRIMATVISSTIGLSAARDVVSEMIFRHGHKVVAAIFIH